MKTTEPTQTLKKAMATATGILLIAASAIASAAQAPASADNTGTQQADLPKYLNTRQGFDVHALPEDQVSPSLQKGMPAHKQLMKRTKGVSTPDAVIQQNRKDDSGSRLVFFPSTPPKMMPYLDGIYVFGNTCIQPGAVINEDPLSTGAQIVKNRLSDVGFQYSFNHGFNYTGITGPRPIGGQRDFTSYNASLLANWFLMRTRDGSQGLFIATEWDWGDGINYNQRNGGPNKSLGSLQNPAASSRGGGSYLANVSLGYSAFDGKLVLMVGQLDATNYLDQNAYSASGFNNLLNESFEFNQALPIPFGAWGYHVAWQPVKSFYLMAVSAGNNYQLNHNPFQYINKNAWTNMMEAGFVSDDFMGWGPGTIRFQYAWTRTGSENGNAVGINWQQQLGKHSTLGWFGRLGWADPDAAAINGVKSAVTTGLVWQAPWAAAGPFRYANNDQLALGFLWLTPADSIKPVRNNNEYGIELAYVMQITPTMTIEPDIQITRNPVHGNGKDTNVVFQIQNTWHW